MMMRVPLQEQTDKSVPAAGSHVNRCQLLLICGMVDFLNEIGIPTVFDTLNEPTFLPGVLIDSGSMRVDQSKLAYPGDLLHEAGHIAVSKPEDRIKMVGDAGGGGMGDEIAAMLWSFAAVKALNLPEEIRLAFDGLIVNI